MIGYHKVGDWNGWTDKDVIGIIDHILEMITNFGLYNLKEFPSMRNNGSYEIFVPLKRITGGWLSIDELMTSNPYHSAGVPAAVGSTLANMCGDLHTAFKLARRSDKIKETMSQMRNARHAAEDAYGAHHDITMHCATIFNKVESERIDLISQINAAKRDIQANFDLLKLWRMGGDIVLYKLSKE